MSDWVVVAEGQDLVRLAFAGHPEKPEKQAGPDRTREHEDAERRGNRPAPPPPRTDAEREADARSRQVTPDDTPEQRQDANK